MTPGTSEEWVASNALNLLCIDELTVSHTEVLRGGYDVEMPSPPERTAAVGCDDDREPSCHGIGVDGKW